MSDFVRGMVSVVVPTYFSERYLDKCLSCIVNQSYPSLEVIVVDGSSEDRTPEIIEKYEKEYPFVRAVHKENRGVSDSRNCGMSEARGEYLQFVDSDDFLMPDACSVMVKKLEETGADVVIGGYILLKTGEERHPVPALLEGADELAGRLSDYYHYRKNCLNTPWNKLYRREGLTARFPLELSMGEDLMFNLQVFEGARRIAVIQDLVYEYNNVNDQSLAYRYREDGFEIETMLHRKMQEFAVRHGAGEQEVLFENYLFGVKAKITALVKKSGLPGRECRRRIRMWTEDAAVRELAEKKVSRRMKDRLLLFMLRHHMKNGLYWYYRVMA